MVVLAGFELFGVYIVPMLYCCVSFHHAINGPRMNSEMKHLCSEPEVHSVGVKISES